MRLRKCDGGVAGSGGSGYSDFFDDTRDGMRRVLMSYVVCYTMFPCLICALDCTTLGLCTSSVYIQIGSRKGRAGGIRGVRGVLALNHLLAVGGGWLRLDVFP